MNEKSLSMLQELPRWRDDNGKIVTPIQVLSVASKLLEALAENLTNEDQQKVRAVCIDAAAFVKLISDSPNERKIPRVAEA